MQASKIIPHQTYAIKRGEELVRFYVSEVITVTRRKGAKANPHDHTSEVTGYITDDDGKIKNNEGRTLVKIDPTAVMGEYTDYQELVERKRIEDEADKAKRKAENQTAVDLALLLYKLTGLAKPENLGTYHGAFRTSGRDISVSYEGVKALLATLTTRKEAA